MDLNDTGNRVIAGMVLSLIFIGGWWLIARNSLDMSGSPASQQGKAGTKSGSEERGFVSGSPSGDTPTIAASDESIDVVDQPAGMNVMVAKVSIVQTGWIAVRDADGRTLGAARFEPGTHVNVEVPLLRATERGQRYQALIYVDDGDKEFDLHKDILVMLAVGSVAGDVFAAQ